jgi:GPH family glycoside/pentoside/hexuronide:cation symporter
MVGYWSDRTTLSFGRRRSWMLASAIPFGLMAVMLWSPPEDLDAFQLHAWVIVSVFGFFTAHTLFYVPHLALGAEMSDDPALRFKVFGARQIAYTLGMLLAFSFAAPMLVDSETARGSARLLSGWGAAAAVTSIVVCTLALPAERKENIGRGAHAALPALRDVLANPHARLLLFVYFVEIFGIGGTSAMTIYVLKYITKAADQLGLVFLMYTVPGLLSIPFWVALGKRFERRDIWLAAMGIQAIGYGSMALQDEGRIALMIGTSVLTGVGTACGSVYGHAIKADVIDYDEYMTGERKEGTYFAAWSLAGKFGTGLMIAISGWALQAAGFQPDAEQTSTARWTILFLMGGAPFLCILIGMAAFTRFRLTNAAHARIRRELDQRVHDVEGTAFGA